MSSITKQKIGLERSTESALKCIMPKWTEQELKALQPRRMAQDAARRATLRFSWQSDRYVRGGKPRLAPAGGHH